MMRRFRPRIWPAVAALMLGVAACAPAASTPPVAPAKDASKPTAPPQKVESRPVEMPKVRIGQAVDSLGYGPIYIAENKGFFKEAGVEVERLTVAGGNALNAAFVAGDFDLAASTGNTAVELKAQGKDAITVYLLNSQNTIHLVASKKFLEEKGVNPSSKLDEKVPRLKGMTLGAPSLGGTTTEAINFIMSKGGLKEGQGYSIVQVGSGSALVAASESGQVDGFAASPPAPFEATARGKIAIVVRPSEIPEWKDYYHSSVLAKSEYAKKNAGAIKKVFAALDRAKKLVKQDFEGALAAIKVTFPRMQEQTLRESLEFFVDAYGPDGRMAEATWKNTLTQLKPQLPAEFKMDASEGLYWTNEFLP